MNDKQRNDEGKNNANSNDGESNRNKSVRATHKSSPTSGNLNENEDEDEDEDENEDVEEAIQVENIGKKKRKRNNSDNLVKSFNEPVDEEELVGELYRNNEPIPNENVLSPSEDEEEFDLSFDARKLNARKLDGLKYGKSKIKRIFAKKNQSNEANNEENNEANNEANEPTPMRVIKTARKIPESEDEESEFDEESDEESVKPLRVIESARTLQTFRSKDMLECIDRGVDKADYPTEKWKRLLPKGTKRFRIKLSDDFSCNFLLLIYILKDFDKKYKYHKISDIKRMLIRSYNKLESQKDTVLEKWTKENKKDFAKKIKKGESFESIILSPNYFISTIDIVVIMYFYKLPIVLLYQQKGSSFTLSMRNEKTYYYFIKLKTNTQFFLHYIDSKLLKTLRFNNRDLSNEMARQIDPIYMTDYLENKRL